MTEVKKAQNDAEFLAMVPSLLGRHVRESLVCVLFHGTRTADTFRIDLPTRHRHADYRGVADAVVRIASSAASADRVAVVIYTDSSFEHEHGMPWIDFADLLLGRIHRTGLHFVGAWCVAADAWGDYFERPRPLTRHSMSEILDSPLAEQGLPDANQLGRLPEVDPSLAREVRTALDRVTSLRDPQDLIEHCLQGDPAPLDLAELVAQVQSPATRDLIVHEVAFGRIVGDAVAAQNRRLAAVQRELGGTMDEVVAHEIAAGRERADDEIANLIVGRGRIRPDAVRIDRAIAVLETAAGAVRDSLQPPLLCMLAWLSWARGWSTPAVRYIETALGIDPSYGMTLALRSLLNAGVVPQWALPT